MKFVMMFILCTLARAEVSSDLGGVIRADLSSQRSAPIHALGRIVPSSGFVKVETKGAEDVLNILSPNGVTIRLDLPVKHAKFVSAGQAVRVWFSNSPSRKIESRVLEILPPSGVGDTTQGVRLEPVRPPSGTTLDSIVNAEIFIPVGGGMEVPATAVGFYGGRHYVIKKSDVGFEPIAVQILSELRNTLVVRPIPGARISSGDAILSKQVIFLLPNLLGRREK